MTAEIAIMNKSAIALATDSAVTVPTNNGQKIYNSVDKLFTLSKCQPVGAMIFSNAEFMGVPWESLIKTYRESLGRKSFEHLEAYRDDFFSYLEKFPFFGPERQSLFFGKSLTFLLTQVRSVVDGAIKKELRQKAGVELDVVPIVNDQLRRLLAAMDKYQELVVKPAVDEVEKQVEAELSGALLASLWSKVFAKIPLLEETSDLVHQVSRKMLVRWCDFPWNTGLVLAGYGSADIFPSVVSFRLDSMMMGKLRYVQGTGGKITFDNEAAILPFAQAEMVHEFMEGIDKSYVEMLGSAFEGALQGFGESLLDGLHYLRKTEKGLVKGKLEENARKMTEKLLNEFEAIRRENNVRPVLDAVAALPKPELATMAETLVGLTSFKRKMSTQTETVGGPVDVALISRGDGFVWVKRKRYFDPLLNSHFFQNYLDFECVLKGVDSDNAE